MKYWFPAGVCLGVSILTIMGCGGNSSNCQVVALNVGPSTATVSHTAVAPNNSQTFSAISKFQGLCPEATAALVSSNWTASDPSVHLSSFPATQVTATCTGAVPNPVTITATSADGRMLTGTASLMCN